MSQVPVTGAGAEGGGVQPCAAPGRVQVLSETGLQFLHPGPATTRYNRYLFRPYCMFLQEMEITKIKIHWLGYRFSIDFQIHTRWYGFLFENHKHLAKVSRFLV
jgi:hypothetical protein